MAHRHQLIAVIAAFCLISFAKAEINEEIIAKDAILEYGKTADLQCILTGATSYDSLRWYRGEQELKEERTEEDSEPKYVIHYANSTLEIHHATELDMGEYECVFELDNGQQFKQIVNLNAEPYVKKFEPKSKNLVQGDPLELHCKAFGYPLPTVNWLKEEDPIFWDTDRVTLSLFNGVENATLRIEDMDFDDRANYVCVANNKYGAHNATVLVRVKDKLAALWPFLGICAEVIVLCAIIFIYEKRRAKKMEEEETPEEAGHLTNSHDHKGKDDIRQRK